MSSPWKPDETNVIPFGSLNASRLFEREMEKYNVRRSLFDPLVAADASWSMLMELFLAYECREFILTTDLQRISGVPFTTALRYLNYLDRVGMISRNKSESDGRATEVRLSDDGHDQMVAYVAAVRTMERATPRQRKDLFAQMKLRQGKSIFPWRRTVDYIADGGV